MVKRIQVTVRDMTYDEIMNERDLDADGKSYSEFVEELIRKGLTVHKIHRDGNYEGGK